MRLLNLCAFPIIIAYPEVPPLQPYYANPAPSAVSLSGPSNDAQAAAQRAGYPHVFPDLEPGCVRGDSDAYTTNVEIPTGDTSKLLACRIGVFSGATDIVNFPEIPDDVQGVVVPLAVAEAMRRTGKKVRYGVLVFTPMMLKEGLNKEGKMVKYAPGLLLHEDLTERQTSKAAEQEASVAHSTYL